MKAIPFTWVDGVPIDFNALQTSQGERLSNPIGALGSSLAGAPVFQGNIRLRYEVTLSDYDAFAQIGAVHQSSSHATTNPNPLSLDVQGSSTDYIRQPFTTYDAAVGIGRGGWQLQLYGQNLADTRAQLYANYADYYKGVTVNRPRTIGLRVSYTLSGS